MLDNDAMREAIRAAIKASGHTHAYIAAEMGVTEQAITGWLRTGRIDKRRLPALARITRQPLSNFMPGAGDGEGLREVPPPEYSRRGGDGPKPPDAQLWDAYRKAPTATRSAVDLLLLPPKEREQVAIERPTLAAGIELLELHAAAALLARQSA